MLAIINFLRLIPDRLRENLTKKLLCLIEDEFRKRKEVHIGIDKFSETLEKQMFIRRSNDANTMETISRIEHLDFGLYFMKPRETTEAEIKILQGLLPNITRELTLNAWSFGRREREFEQMLQQQLNELPFIEPGVRITFDRGQQRYIQQERQ